MTSGRAETGSNPPSGIGIDQSTGLDIRNFIYGLGGGYIIMSVQNNATSQLEWETNPVRRRARAMME
jgi:hypothetical protein